jgi:hypothetical protein
VQGVYVYSRNYPAAATEALVPCNLVLALISLSQNPKTIIGRSECAEGGSFNHRF